jgi:DnaD/phage-associated family protein
LTGENKFQGFPARPEVTPLPNIFFSEVSPQIRTLAEYKIVMHVFFLLSRRRGYPRFVTYYELLNDPVVLLGLSPADEQHAEILKDSLENAVNDGILLKVPLEAGEKYDEAYFINNENERGTIDRIIRGELKIPHFSVRKIESHVISRPADIYTLYEQNVGILTPIIAEELQQAEQQYPAEWIQDAFREAVRTNVRNWKYINSILRRWEREGRKDGKHVGDAQKERDPDKYVRGKYGHMVQR